MAEPKDMSTLHSDILRSIPEFSGDKASVPVREFSEKIQTVKTLVGWEDQIAIAIVKLKVTGPARAFLAADPKAKESSKLDEILNVLIAQFARKEDLATLHHELARMAQYSNETMKEWGARIKKIGARFLRVTADSPLLKEMLQSKFEQGAKSADMRRFLRWRKFESFDDMIAAADQEERRDKPIDRPRVFGTTRVQPGFVPKKSAPSRWQPQHQPRRTTQDHSHRTEKELLKTFGWVPRPPAQNDPEIESPTCWNCGRKGHTKRKCTLSPDITRKQTGKPLQRSVVHCYACGEANHFARECPNKKRSGNAKGPSFRLG